MTLGSLIDHDACIKAAQRYRSRTEWASNDRSTYRFALANKALFKACTAHLPKKTGRKRVHTLESCQQTAQKFRTRQEWRNKDPRSYGAAKKAGWLEQCTGHMLAQRRNLTRSICINSAKQYSTIGDWQKADNSAYVTARKHGWIQQCTQHMLVTRQSVSFERCFQSAQRYKTRSAWEKGDLGAYKGALKHGWMDECAKHMTAMRQSHTKEDCLLIASRYTTITEWRMGDPATYAAAKHYGWLKDVSAHMRRIGGTSTQEKELREQLSAFVSDMIGDYKIPNIRQRLDCYSPSRRVGIEYNGLYWHSEEKKGRNYHLDKTNSCKERGIRLIHIWGHEWANRRRQVLSFLRSALGANTLKIGARKCRFEWVEPTCVRQLIEDTHIQGYAPSTHAVGVYHQGQLVGAATFGRHHRGGGDTVLNRLVFRDGVTVNGGFSKISKMAREKLGAIISWVDLAKSDGAGYIAAGWQVEKILKPDYFYWHPLHGVRSKQARKKKAVGTPEGMTEREHAAAEGWYRIYDCGKMRLRYK